MEFSEKPPEETPIERVTRNAFNALSADEKRYVLAAKQDGIEYRGESFADFVRVVDEAERLQGTPGLLDGLKEGGINKLLKRGE